MEENSANCEAGESLNASEEPHFPDSYIDQRHAQVHAKPTDVKTPAIIQGNDVVNY